MFWILILVLKCGSGTASVTIPMQSKAACEKAVENAKAKIGWASSFQDSYCINNETGELK